MRRRTTIKFMKIESPSTSISDKVQQRQQRIGFSVFVAGIKYLVASSVPGRLTNPSSV